MYSSVKHNICYFKYAFKLQLGHSPQWSFLSPKVPPLCECLESIPEFVSIYIIFSFCLHILFFV